MTPAQQAALVAVAGRALTAEELSTIEPLLAWDNRQDVQIAEVINAGRPTVLRSLKVEEVFSVLFASGDYTAIKAAQLAGDQRAIMAFGVLADARNLGPGTVNLEAAPTVALLETLQAEPSLLSASGRQALTDAAAERVQSIHYTAVSAALNIAEGRATL